ncbi:hypothetical protein, variant 1 [Aphanomyces astaci]|uniref:Uncharacterized protein n=1 Tax=Aphanomyces astaci TaxID=112090 RepID=W4GW04_APHAT|nr:hypothetical protein H257_04465 [Aphanomyces astaci]XP_009827293.1 hypothetical protein, variant 2 [Aphanomyces astaci]XP_009827294.1 hypothetical protein, variant 1 [Aphanomyces astaci]ETV83862.1 hypothetical protein H257_04465 [Aphanomyces astaci]ETV83863.1 hypothetical protein, variant 1 [Aphanomyces astaci]ETV83864.1 hypothetical protein, variant 2 [Aphanomyces astaci]|eukprot:XP_009827292.1 hypothetical protein H257_04465 [Aphanomyces astaci]
MPTDAKSVTTRPTRRGVRRENRSSSRAAIHMSWNRPKLTRMLDNRVSWMPTLKKNPFEYAMMAFMPASCCDRHRTTATSSWRRYLGLTRRPSLELEAASMRCFSWDMIIAFKWSSVSHGWAYSCCRATRAWSYLFSMTRWCGDRIIHGNRHSCSSPSTMGAPKSSRQVISSDVTVKCNDDTTSPPRESMTWGSVRKKARRATGATSRRYRLPTTMATPVAMPERPRPTVNMSILLDSIWTNAPAIMMNVLSMSVVRRPRASAGTDEKSAPMPAPTIHAVTAVVHS